MGKNGLCITLPMEWTEARGIKKGDVMQLVEVGKGLHMVKVEV